MRPDADPPSGPADSGSEPRSGDRADPVDAGASDPRPEWAGLTPYEIGVPGREFADHNFSAIAEEAGTRGVDPSDPGAFLMLGEVGRVLREIREEDERGGEALQRFGAFLFHAFHMHRAGEPLILVERAAARHLVDDAPDLPAWAGELPGDAGYLQLPRHLFWSRPDEEGHAEPVDGIFWARSADRTLSLLVALGVRGDRPGFSTMSLPPLPLAHAPSWLIDPARDGGDDFETTLPGGELDRLYSIETLGEVAKLTGRILAYLHGAPDSLGEEERSPRARDLPEDHGGPVPSSLPFRRIRWVG